MAKLIECRRRLAGLGSGLGTGAVFKIRFPALRDKPLTHIALSFTYRTDGFQQFRSSIDLGDISMATHAQGISHHLQGIMLA